MSPSERFKRLTCNEHIRGDLRRSSVRATLFTVMAGFADLVLRIGSTAVLARLLLPEHFGIVMMVMAVTAIADQLRDLGLSTATVQRKEITYEEVCNLFWVNASFGLLIALVVCAASPVVSAYYREPRLTLIACILSTNFICGGLLVQHQALLARQLRLGRTASVRVIASTLSTVLAIIFAWLGYGYWSLVWREVARNVFLVIGIWLCFPWIPGWPSRGTDIRKLLAFGGHVVGANLICSLAGAMDRLLLGRFQGPAPVAIYRQAYQLLVVPMDQILSPMFNVTQPGLSILQDDATRYRRFYEKVLKVVCLISMPLSAFVAANSAEITRVILGRNWLECAGILSILSVGTFIKSPVGWSALILITRGRSKEYLALTIVQSVCSMVAMSIGVFWGITGIAVANAAATWLTAPVTLYLSFNNSPVTLRSFFSAIARPATASCVMGISLKALPQVLPPFGDPLFLVLSSLFAVATFAGTWLLLPGGLVELKALSSDVLAFRRLKVDRGIEAPPSAAANPL